MAATDIQIDRDGVVSLKLGLLTVTVAIAAAAVTVAVVTCGEKQQKWQHAPTFSLC